MDKEYYDFWDNTDPDREWRDGQEYPWQHYDKHKDDVVVECSFCDRSIVVPSNVGIEEYIMKRHWKIMSFLEGKKYCFCPRCKNYLTNE